MQIIPAIDIIDGKCVRLTQGNFAEKKIYHENPLEIALQFEDAGLKRLHLVDLDGAKTGIVQNWKTLEIIADNTSLIIDFGGGIKTEKDLRIVFDSGAEFATVGSIAIKNEPELLKWFKVFGAEKFLLGADVRGKKIVISGWLETTDTDIEDFIERYAANGITQFFCTDVSKDGKLEGPSTILYKTLAGKFPDLKIIASGGVSSLNDIYELRQAGCSGVIVGKAIYEGRIDLHQLANVNV
jgi:phosphoribosylformimino-5-aminoimidazole carboxamide ribotide isomerase